MRPGWFSSVTSAVVRCWRHYLVDECHDERMERIRRERIQNIWLGVATLEAARQWQIRNGKLSLLE